MKKAILLSTLIVLLMSFTIEKKATIYAPVNKNIQALTNEFDQIPDERKKALKKLAVVR